MFFTVFKGKIIYVRLSVANKNVIFALLTKARTALFALKTANGKREKWREFHVHVVFLPFAFAVSAMLNLSINPLSPNSDEDEICLYIFTTYSNIQVMRITEVITKDKMS